MRRNQVQTAIRERSPVKERMAVSAFGWRLFLGGMLVLWGSALVGMAADSDKTLYFPPEGGAWESVPPKQVGWDEAKLNEVLKYCGRQRSTGVVVLHRGRILAERYWELTGERSAKFNQRLAGRDAAGRGIEDVASVQKSVVSVLVGIAQEKGLLQLDDPVSLHLGSGWSKASPDQEQAITVRHLITMTSGLNLRGQYAQPPGTKWLYNTRVYAKTVDVLAAVAKLDRHRITQAWLTEPLGMADSRWVSRGALAELSGNGFGFATTARDLARFGLLMLAEGNWDGQVVLGDSAYLTASTSSSQKLNPAYGYLWWVTPGERSQRPFGRSEAGPRDLFAAKGALIRRCYVVPSWGLVVTRLGDQPKVGGRVFDARVLQLLQAAAPKDLRNP